MGKEFEQIDEKMVAWVEKQPMFFVSTSPLSKDGHVNCSPKGRDTLRILGPNEIAYLDMGGSGIETVAHVNENQRIVIMLCAFEGPPRIVRFHGKGEVVEPGAPEFKRLLETFPASPSARSIIKINVTRISDSCGYGVPRMEYQGPRDQIERYLEQRRPKDVELFMAENNEVSYDGLPGLSKARIKELRS